MAQALSEQQVSRDFVVFMIQRLLFGNILHELVHHS